MGCYRRKCVLSREIDSVTSEDWVRSSSAVRIKKVTSASQILKLRRNITEQGIEILTVDLVIL